jgi:hypothetical protein
MIQPFHVSKSSTIPTARFKSMLTSKVTQSSIRYAVVFKMKPTCFLAGVQFLKAVDGRADTPSWPATGANDCTRTASTCRNHYCNT